MKIFNNDGSLFSSFFAYDAAFSGGVYIAAGNVLVGSSNQVITGAGEGGGSHVKVLNIDPGTGAATVASEFFAFPGFFGGTRVGLADPYLIGNPLTILTSRGPVAGFGIRWRAFRLVNGVFRRILYDGEAPATVGSGLTAPGLFVAP